MNNRQMIDLVQSGRPREAIDLARANFRIYQHLPAFHLDLCNAYAAAGEIEAAELGFRGALNRWPEYRALWNGLGGVLIEKGDVGGAVVAQRRALAIDDKDVYTLAALGLAEIEQFELAGGLAHLAVGAALANEARYQSVYLGYSLHTGYREDLHRDWVDRFSPWHRQTPPIRWDGSRPIRVAFMGNQFRDHACSYVLEPLLAALDRQKIHALIFSDVAQPDATTGRLKALAQEWTDTVGWADDKLDSAIRESRVDVLIDTAGHKRGGRIMVMARKPAPVQLTMIGYAGDTLLGDNVDQEIGWAFRPDPDAPPVARLPLRQNGYLTFGAFNRAAKVSPESIQSWADALAAVPGSMIVVAARGGEENAGARAALERGGIPADRLSLVGWQPTRRAFLELAGRIDVHLDTQPYQGGATTLDLLWQGVPTLTRDGGRFQMGRWIMERAGLAAAHRQMFVGPDIGALAGSMNSSALSDFRQHIRGAMEADGMLDGAGPARRLENLLAARMTTDKPLAAAPAGCCP